MSRRVAERHNVYQRTSYEDLDELFLALVSSLSSWYPTTHKII